MPRVDGRVVRGSRNRDAIVDAIVDLNLEGAVRPSVAEVAARAGVAERSVFRHFADMAELHEAAARRHLQRIAPLIVDVAPDGDLDDRIEQFVLHRARLLEANSPIRRATDLREPFYPELRKVLDRARAALRRQVEFTFSPELDAHTKKERNELLDALDVSACWETWEHLRAHRRTSYDATSAVVRRMLSSLLA